MKITAIKALPEKKAFSAVYLDGKFYGYLKNSLISENALEAGTEISESGIKDIIKQSKLNKAVDYALLLLTYRPRSVSEVKQKMQSKGYEDGIIEDTVSELKRRGRLDDRKFASWWIEQRRSGRPKGDIAIKAELKSAGVKERIIDEAFAEKNLNRAEDELGLAWEACSARLESYRGLPREKVTRRLGNMLRRRGFSYEVINKVVNGFLNDERQ